jgi:GDPmannose 4,6-dehydratase
MASKKALIIGISGQDGAYLARYLLNKGYDIFGTSRDAVIRVPPNLARLGLHYDQMTFIQLFPEDSHKTLLAISQSEPNEIYYLASQSSVALSFEQPADTIKSCFLGLLNVLEACRYLNSNIRIYNAGTSEVWGNTMGLRANETMPFSPLSPYAVAKASACILIKNYRDSYGMYASSGMMFNHESPLRGEQFVTKKIIKAAKSILDGESDSLTLGNLEIERDWGWAGEYVEAMWLMLQQDKADDFVIATGKTNSLKQFVKYVFDAAGLEVERYIRTSNEFIRPQDVKKSLANPEKANNTLGWKATILLPEIASRMLSDKY